MYEAMWLGFGLLMGGAAGWNLGYNSALKIWKELYAKLAREHYRTVYSKIPDSYDQTSNLERSLKNL